MRRHFLGFTVLYASLEVFGRSGMAQDACEAMKNLTLAHATVISATHFEAGQIAFPVGSPSKIQNFAAPQHCEVKVVSKPTSDSEINIEIWLPEKATWNGKYLQLGSGGWDGAIARANLLEPLKRDYTVSATDDGHQGSSAVDASFAVGHPERLIDFGYRALGETASISKAIIQAYYDKAAAHSYFNGCSDGGREALMVVERFPEDFDGVIAGAAANNWTHQFIGFIWDEMALYRRPESVIPPDKLPMIEKAVLAACDELDGVKDGIISDPRQCHFDPSVLLCKGSATGDCLTQPQIDALKKIYEGPIDPRTGEQIYPGYEPGGEAEFGTWQSWIVAGAVIKVPVQALFGNGFFADAVFENPAWDWHTIDFDRDLRLADERIAPIINANDPDFRTFRDHGGKLIQYSGWNDAAVAPRDAINFYDEVSQFLARHPDPRSTDRADLNTFYRLFMVPGMAHCTGGPGPTSFGNINSPSEQPQPDDPDHDILSALDRWVTKGVAPDRLIGTGKLGADPRTGAEGIPISRPLCPFPKIARYQGQGDTNSAENFKCVEEQTK